MPPEFIRARRPEHKRQRREAILAAARDLASGSGVASVSLGRVASAAGIAKSNVARYFATREEIYLELATREMHSWADDVATRLPVAADADELAGVLVDSLHERPLLCDLIVHSSLTLPGNSSYDAIRGYKLAILEAIERIRTAITAARPDLTAPDATQVIVAGAALTAFLQQASLHDRRLADHPAMDHDLAAAYHALQLDPRKLVAAILRGM